ncbi:AMP-dependent synthetase/ligase [Rhodococcus daqingensis]|uniref:Acyl-CoA synthetase n=1 Tax=Rhodococcus daqingensis TaxID=2479363 RepID=A0ABW2RZ12_9NOCA
MNTSIASPRTLCEAFQATAARYPDSVALRTPGDGIVITWRLYAERVSRIAAGLAKLGVRRGDTVGIMLTNRPEFHLVDTGALHAGATPFSVYNSLAVEQLNYVLGNAGNKVMVCEEQFLPVIEKARAGTAVEHVVCVDAAPEGTMSLQDLESSGDPDFDFESSWQSVEPGDVLTIIYTSGTTGPPKGVELTHENILAETEAIRRILPCGPDDRIVSYLPDAHIANRWGAHYHGMGTGIQITTLADMKQAIVVLPEVRPTIFAAVPQVWYKLKAAIELALAEEPSPVKKRLANWAIGVGRRRARLQSDGTPVPRALQAQHALADRLVLGAIRKKLGLDEVRAAVSGAAAISPEVLEFVLGLGIPCCEGWGMSELSCLATINRPDAIRIGTVGQVVTGATLKLAEDGELLVAGPLVMKGYRGDPEKTAETIGADGWLHTGDIATIDEDGYVRIVDRKKELIVNAAGKNMSPSNIEGAIRAASPLIGGAVVIGNDRPYVVALLTLDPDAAAAFATRNGIHNGSPGDLASNPVVRAEVDRAIAAANEKLSRVEQVKKFTLLSAIWEPGGDEFTPTMKLRRKPIDSKYAREIEELYAG